MNLCPSVHEHMFIDLRTYVHEKWQNKIQTFIPYKDVRGQVSDIRLTLLKDLE